MNASPPSAGTAVLDSAAAPHLAVTRRRLGAWALAWALALVAFGAAEGGVPGWTRHPSWQSRVADPAVAFGALRGLALGVLLAYARRAPSTPWLAAPVSAAVTALVELTAVGQGGAGALWAPVAAALAASTGATCTVALLGSWRRRAEHAAVRLLDHPLVGAIALAVPVVWHRAGAPDGVWIAAVTALPVALLIGALRASRGPAARGGAVRTAAIAGLCTLGVLGPGLAHDPRAVLVGAAGAALLAGVYAPLAGGAAAERRFERAALARAAPLALLALLAGALAPAAPLDLAGTAALLGFVAAEWRGRREERAAGAWRRIWPALAAVFALQEAVRGAALDRAWPDAIVPLTVALAAARVGASLYAAQRAHVRALRARGRGSAVHGRARARRAVTVARVVPGARIAVR